MGIPIGRMALYTPIGGIRSEYCMPVMLDVGTDNEERLKSPIYIGWRHNRVRGAEYDDFLDAFTHCVKQRWPRVLLQWEATAHDLINWTNGRALIGAGSLFESVAFDGKRIPVTQANNVYIFPGLALGIISARANRISDGMIKAATEELVRHLPTLKAKDAPLLPPISKARELSPRLSQAVGKQAIREGLAEISDESELEMEIVRSFWEPAYVPYELVQDTR